MSTNDEKALTCAYLPLRIAFGLVPILAGLDKFANLLTDWSAYLAPAAARLLPVSPDVFFGFVGIVEIAVGILVWTRFVRLGAFAAMGWLFLIAINLIAAGDLDIAVRDLVLAVAAFVLAQLAGVQARRGAGAARTAAS